ncbi:MAG: N-formylglutamate amidohydrolase [Verrucomicrobia bacterium]|nr:N-formylglutamate amidohydrolase [Verrucomicrobiota bacterium]MDA1068003.1 N-formylglutamate amidohydrolase [Verrucomicrobiota bacterium]
MKIVLSCEHASAALLEGFERLFAEKDQTILWSHRGWDPGAFRLAQELKDFFDAPLVRGEWTRLLLDLNRSIGNPDRWSEYSRSLTESQQKELEEKVFEPYWAELFENISDAINESDCVLHLSIHSFVRMFNNKERQVDIGVLYDPDRSKESRFATSLCAHLQKDLGDRLRIKENVPYAGTDDGLTTVLRTHFANNQYLGIEIEVCSDLLEDRKSIETMGAHLASAISRTVAEV